MRGKHLGFTAAATLAMAGLAGCGTTAAGAPGAETTATAASGSSISLVATEFKFAPDTVNLRVGQTVTLTITNTGSMGHDMKSEIPLSGLAYVSGMGNPLDEQRENIADGVFDVDYDAGAVAVLRFTPTKAGTFSFHCDVAGHTEAGMTGTFVVTA